MNLFHVVFEAEFRQVTIVDNLLREVEGPFALVES
jgi:hypothetical protein